jgi:hypothetical protein
MPEVIDYTKAPLGSLPGESGLQAPYNGTTQNVVVRVRNLSATVKRKIVQEHVSWRRGGEVQLSDKKYAAENFGNTSSVDQLRLRAANNEDMNKYDYRVEPQSFVARFDNRRYEIPPFDQDGNPAPWITVPSGLWDLFMGNYERMNSRNGRERTNEMAMLNGRNLNRFVIGESNMGYLEFSREEIKVSEVLVDQDRVRSGSLIEV